MCLIRELSLRNLMFSMVGNTYLRILNKHVIFWDLMMKILDLSICSDRGQNIVTNNSLSIYVESGNIIYQNFNTNENFYSFLLVTQDETKSIVPERFSYSYSFEKYMNSFLPSFSIV